MPGPVSIPTIFGKDEDDGGFITTGLFKVLARVLFTLFAVVVDAFLADWDTKGFVGLIPVCFTISFAV